LERKIRVTHASLFEAIIQSTSRENKNFRLEPKFVADKIIASFLGQFSEWRYLNRDDDATENCSLNLTNGNQASLNLKNGSIRIGFRAKLNAIFQAWTYFTIVFFSTFTFKKLSKTHYIFLFSLTKEQIYKNRKATEFWNFIRQDRFTFNNERQKVVYLVECKNKYIGQISGKEIKITRNILLYLFRNGLSPREKFKVVFESFKAAIRLTILLPTCNWLFLFAKEIVIEEPILRIGSGSSNFDFKLITTQSHLFMRPLIFYRESEFEKSMMWYSSNSYPIVKIKDEFEDYESTQFETAEIDVHYVWSEAHSNFIKKRNKRKVSTKVVGSIIFQPIRKAVDRKLNKNRIQITYFDVTPTRIWYHQNGFYSEENLVSILLSIIKVIREVEVQTSTQITLNLKPKRKFKKGHHSDRYKELVDSLVSSQEIEILQSNVDLYNLVNESDIVLSVPFSSPCLIAHEMGVPNAYYSCNPEFTLECPEKEINLLLSEGDLKKFIVSSLQKADIRATSFPI
jgi:polysaccharide biosynthesis PFTS motif protein